MPNMIPTKRVLISQDVPSTVEVSKSSSYIDIFTKEERDAIVEKYRTPNLFDGDCVRLDAISNGVAYISPVTFYDFLCCNLVGIHNKDPIAYKKMFIAMLKYGPIDSFEKLLTVQELPHVICTNVLLHDVNYEYLLVQRNTTVSVGSGVLACTSSGSMTLEDLSAPNPIIRCAERELAEELNLQCNLQIIGICAPLQKLQPVVLLTGMVFRPWREILPAMKTAQDFEKENKCALVVPQNKLLPLICYYSFTDAAAYHIFYECDGDATKWKKAEKEFVKVQNFYV